MDGKHCGGKPLAQAAGEQRVRFERRPRTSFSCSAPLVVTTTLPADTNRLTSVTHLALGEFIVATVLALALNDPLWRRGSVGVVE